MYADADYSLLQNCPEWYRVEKDSENIIKKLYSIKELSFYLKNPDQYIRRLAILRIGELKLKDSIEVLKDILDDHLESPQNRSLAAWVIKSISLKWDIELFISNKLLDKYRGKEKYDDICKVSINDSLHSIKFKFSSALIDSELNFINDDVHRSADTYFDMPFPFEQWLKKWCKEVILTVRNTILNLPAILLKNLLTLFKFVSAYIFIKLPRIIYSFILNNRNSRIRRKKAHMHQEVYSRNRYANKRSFISIIKSAGFNILYVALAPLRLILRHKKFAFAMLVIYYCLVSFTTPGKLIVYKYFGINISEVQGSVYKSTKEKLSFVWSEFEDIFGIKESASTDGSGKVLNKTSSKNVRMYRVISKTGLSLREAPDEASEKIINKVIAYNTTVKYLLKTERDSSGELWDFVQIPGGITGWLNSKWLEKSGGE